MKEIIEIMARGISKMRGTKFVAPIHQKCAQAAISALKEAGWAIVPVDPSEAMIEAFCDEMDSHQVYPFDNLRRHQPDSGAEIAKDAYRAAIKAGEQT